MFPYAKPPIKKIFLGEYWHLILLYIIKFLSY
nr:MAG TPA_asm: hypothetical protein [Bacteriophage sp.]